MSFIERRWRPRKRMTRDQLLGIANYLTYARIAMVPVVVLAMAFIHDDQSHRLGMNVFLSWFSMLLFTVAQASDIVDGHYARKYGIVSSFGKFVDPLADKLMALAVLIMLVEMNRIAAWIVILLIAREVTITALRGIAAAEGIEIAASDWGKKKTIVQSIAIGALMIHYPFWRIDPHQFGLFLTGVTVIVSIGSGVHYAWIFFREVMAAGDEGVDDGKDETSDKVDKTDLN